MADIRYEVPGWPARVAGHAAVTPGLTRYAGSGAQAFKDRVTGQPGTQGIPVQAPYSPGGPVAQAQQGRSRSSDAPSTIYPNQYWARPDPAYWPGAGMPISVASDNLMPVPAVDPRGIPALQAFPINQRGQRQIRSTPSFPTWPGVND